MRQGRIVPASSIYWGADMDGDVAILESESARGDAPYGGTGITTWNRFEEHTGKKVSICHFSDKWVAAGEGGLTWDGFGTGASARCIERGAIPMKSIGGPSNVTTLVLEGVFDTHLATWAAEAASFGYPLFLRPWWEMNLSSGFNWTSKENYVAAWRYLHNKIAPTATNVSWAWVPNIIGTGVADPTPYYPGDSYVDWVGMDGYNYGTNPLQAGGWTHPLTVYQPTYNLLRALAPSKPILIGEVASSEFGGSKPGWITTFLGSTLRAMPWVKAFVWFNDNIVKGEGRMDWPIESSAEAQAAFSALIASNYFRAPEAGKFTKGQKVPIP